MSEIAGFSFEGRPIPARPGMSVGAALAMAGVHDLRETRLGDGRGIFCGMGVCQDCLVTIDGRPNKRACVTKAAAGMDVRRQRFPGELPPATRGAPPIGFDDIPTEQADLLVIGGGAGGLTAALHARRAGLDVLLLDERPTRGGQYFKQAAAGPGVSTADLPALDAQQGEGRSLRAEVERSGVRILDEAEAWSPLDGHAVLATAGGRTFIARGRALVVATGAYERAHPVPGWTLPGVMTTGAIQTLWRSYRALPGKRVLIAGNGPLNAQVAAEILAGGAEVVALVEAAPIFSPGRAGAALGLALADPGLARKGLGLLRAVKAGGAVLRFGHVIRRIARAGAGFVVETGDLAGATVERWTVDIVGMGYGFQPSNELLRAFGAAHDYDSAAGMLRTIRSGECETSVTGLFAVGDCAGLGAAPAAMAEGVLAANAAARTLGASPGAEALSAIARARRALARHRRFQRALWRLYAAPRPGLSLAEDDTLVCRCEEVSKRELLDAIGDGAPSIGAVKRRTRCGMGRCQGRYCGPLIVEELARRSGSAIGEFDFFAPRGPVKPVTIGDLVGRR